MKKRIYLLTCLAVLFSNISRGDELPFFSSLRDGIENQFVIASNAPPLNKKLTAGLRSNLKLIDRTKPTLISGSAALGTLAKSLGRTSLSNTFLPILIDTRTVYIAAMETEMSALEGRLAATIPGKAQTAAQAAINKVSAPLENAGTNSTLSGSLKSLSSAAKALVAAQKSVAKAETAPPGPNFLTATVTESNQGVTLYKPTGKENLNGNYDPLSGKIDIHGFDEKDLGGGRVQYRYLTLVAMVLGEGTYTLSLPNASESYADYSRLIQLIDESGPDVEFNEFYTAGLGTRGTGALTITLDLDSKIVWGTFTLTAVGAFDSNLEATVTGSFLLRLGESDDDDE